MIFDVASGANELHNPIRESLNVLSKSLNADFANYLHRKKEVILSYQRHSFFYRLPLF